MSLSETKAFLEDLLLRFDPSLDTTRAQTELIEPILTRIGPDPFDEDMLTFIRERMRQACPQLAISEVDEATDLLIDPLRVLLEPITREIKLAKLRMSLRNIDSLADDEVDALLGNFFEARKQGGFSVGVVRIYFTSPQTIDLTYVNIAKSSGGLRYLVSRPQRITASQMLLNIEGSEYYFDVNYTAENRGTEYDIDVGAIVDVSNLPTATRVRNLRRFRGGVPRETSSAYAARVQQGTSDKTLTTEPGIAAVLPENFPGVRQLFSVGHGDPEMQRDVITGGSLGSIPTDDTLGKFYGTGGPVDDLNADATSPLLAASGGFFVSRLGAVGSDPGNWYVSLSYTSGSLVMVDARVVEIVSESQVRLDHELPLTLSIGTVTWALREKKLTISDIPGGIVLPDGADGSLSVRTDQVHIGGKTDIYVAGEVEEASTQISGLTDEWPLARGLDAHTQQSTSGSEDVVLLVDAGSTFAEATPGMSLVLMEGVDAGAYRILQVLTSPSRVRVDTQMSGTQANLSWKIVNEIDVSLVNPRDVLAEGSDLLTGAGSPYVTTSGSFNFVDAGVQAGDICFVDATVGGGEYQIAEVTAVTLKLEPDAARTFAGVPYKIYRASEGVLTPVLRVKSLELLDSVGAPNGTTIPYRDPVLVVSNAFQNEGSDYLYNGPALIGLVSAGFTGSLAVGATTVGWELRNPERAWSAPAASGTFTFTTGNKTITQMVTEINASSSLTSAGVRATALSFGGLSYLGLTSLRQLTLVAGSALSVLGFYPGWTNCQVRGLPGTSFAALKLRRGDLFEFLGGNNASLGGRLLTDPTVVDDRALVGYGPLGPVRTTALYNNVTLRPDAGSAMRIARPSVGSARVYFLSPTSAEFRYQDTLFATTHNGQLLRYRPDPENIRTIVPPPPQTALPSAGVTSAGANTMSDATSDFLVLGIQPGDILDVLYIPIVGTAPLASSGTIAVGGLTLVIRFGEDPFITISFPYAMPRADVVSYINAQAGMPVASLSSSGALKLSASKRIALGANSTSLSVLFVAALSSDHPSAGSYIVDSVAASSLTLASATPLTSGSVADSYYRIRRYVQRVSSTEMNANVDASGLYYVDVEAISTFPGDHHNIAAGVELEITGHRADGYRLTTANEQTSFSRAEDLRAEVSRTMLLVGSADSPEEYIQLNLQNVQVTYERSPLVDDIQSFCTSAYRRVLACDPLVRHLFPHYVSFSWSYAGGANEATLSRALADMLDALQGGDTLEVLSLTNIVKRNGATSVYTPDTSSATGRVAPFVVVTRHEADRKIRAAIVRDLISTVRTQRYILDTHKLKRLSSSGLR